MPKWVLYGIVLPTLTILNSNDHINPMKKNIDMLNPGLAWGILEFGIAATFED